MLLSNLLQKVERTLEPGWSWCKELQEWGAISGLASLPQFLSCFILVFWQVEEFWEQFCSGDTLSSEKEDLADKHSVLILYGIPQNDDPYRVGMIFFSLSFIEHIFTCLQIDQKFKSNQIGRICFRYVEILLLPKQMPCFSNSQFMASVLNQLHFQKPCIHSNKQLHKPIYSNLRPPVYPV